MTDVPPPEISHLVRQRAEARARRDWPAADALKSQIEAAGWQVVDRGLSSTARRAAPASVEVEGETRYGSASDVPSLLDSPADGPWTVALVASEDPDRTAALLEALRAHAPAGSQVVVVANDPSEAQAAALGPGSQVRAPIAGREPEVLRTVTRLGHAAALNVALRRCAGELVLMADGSAVPQGDAFGPLARALEDPGVAVAGAFGVSFDEKGRLRPAALTLSESPAPAALLSPWLTFRRSDYRDLGPLDEHFIAPAWLDVWWSLRLRCGEEPDWTEAPEPPEDLDAEAEGEEPADFAALELDLPPPRRAFRLDLPLRGAPAWPPERTRLNRRNMYRVLRRYGWRQDLF